MTCIIVCLCYNQARRSRITHPNPIYEYAHCKIMVLITGKTLDFFSHSAAQTQRLGVRLGKLVEPGDTIFLSGPLGSGKTTFAQGIARGVGVDRVVRSPTYTLVSEYEGTRMPMYHIDLYRVEGDEALATIGIEEYFDRDAQERGVVVVEWPEHAQGARMTLPEEALTIRLEHVDETKRRVIIDATGDRYERLLLAFKQAAFGVS